MWVTRWGLEKQRELGEKEFPDRHEIQESLFTAYILLQQLGPLECIQKVNNSGRVWSSTSFKAPTTMEPSSRLELGIYIQWKLLPSLQSASLHQDATSHLINGWVFIWSFAQACKAKFLLTWWPWRQWGRWVRRRKVDQVSFGCFWSEQWPSPKLCPESIWLFRYMTCPKPHPGPLQLGFLPTTGERGKCWTGTGALWYRSRVCLRHT